MSLDIRKHPRYHHHNQSNRQIQDLPKFPCFLFVFTSHFCSKIYSFNKIQNAQYRTVNYRHCVTVSLQSLSVCLNLMSFAQLLAISPIPQPPATTIVISALISFTIVNTSYKWNHAILVFLCLTYFTQGKVHPQALFTMLQVSGFPVKAE